MFIGFARNYYLSIWFGTHVLSPVGHVHGLLMTCWVLFFLTQSLLVSRHRLDLHRRLGRVGGALAAIVVGLGVYTILASMGRQYPDASLMARAEAFVAFDGISLLLFGGLIAAALIARRRPQIHRRLMLVAMISLLPPALGRLVAYFTHQHVEVLVLGLMSAITLTVVLIDAGARRRPHFASLFGGGAVMAANLLTYLAQIDGP